MAAKGQRRFEMRERDNKFDTQNRVHPGGNIWSTIRNVVLEPRRSWEKDSDLEAIGVG